MKRALIQWEILRLPFNLILLTLGLLWSWPLRQTMVEEAFFWLLGQRRRLRLRGQFFLHPRPRARGVFTHFEKHHVRPLALARVGAGPADLHRHDLGLRLVHGDPVCSAVPQPTVIPPNKVTPLRPQLIT